MHRMSLQKKPIFLAPLCSIYKSGKKKFDYKNFDLQTQSISCFFLHIVDQIFDHQS